MSGFAKVEMSAWPAQWRHGGDGGVDDGGAALHVVRTRTIPLPDFAVQRTAASEETDASAITRHIVRLIVTTSAADRTRLLQLHGKRATISPHRPCGAAVVPELRAYSAFARPTGVVAMRRRELPQLSPPRLCTKSLLTVGLSASYEAPTRGREPGFSLVIWEMSANI